VDFKKPLFELVNEDRNFLELVHPSPFTNLVAAVPTVIKEFDGLLTEI